MIGKVLKTLKVSERRACRVLGQVRTTQPHSLHIKNDEERLVARIVELVTLYGRYGQEQNNGPAQTRRLEGKLQEGRENLEKGRAQGATKTTETKEALAE